MMQQNRKSEPLTPGALPVRTLGGEHWLWQFCLMGLFLSGAETLTLEGESAGRRLVFPVWLLACGEAGSQMEADFSSAAEKAENTLLTHWTLSLTVQDGAMRFQAPLRLLPSASGPQLSDPLWEDRRFAYEEPLGAAQRFGQTLEGLICSPSGSDCCLQIGSRLQRYERQLVCQMERCVLRGRHLRLRVRCPAQDLGTWSGVALVYRFRQEKDRLCYAFPAQHTIHQGDEVCLEVEIDLSQLQLKALYWDVRITLDGADGASYLLCARWQEDGGSGAKPRSGLEKLLYRVRKALDLGRRVVERLVFSNTYRQADGQGVSLYRTMEHTHALACQPWNPYSGLRFRLKEWLAFGLALLARPVLGRRRIMLCYEKFGSMAQDNGFYFFRHCMEHGMEKQMHRRIYFVIDKAQPDYQERLLPYKDHVIQFMSLKHMVYLLSASLLVSSDSKSHAYAWRTKESLILPYIRRRKKLVFLQHGVIAMKRVDFYRKGGAYEADLFVSSNRREHDIIAQYLDYPPEDVILTGLARWDVLEDRHLPEKHILLMPTWRNWLDEAPDEVFVESDYYQNYMALLNDPRLAALLTQYDLYLDFYIHPKFKGYMARFSISGSERVRLIPFGEEPLNRLLMECRLMVTDYSSASWDVYYQKKPVLFYQFDVAQYNETTGAYIDFDTELFGERVFTPEELLEALKRYAQADFALPERYAALHGERFAYLDKNNSRRVCEEILKRGW
ncbi:MAG: CDP-glycerol glycerophosphotransferase family protein [Clostridiales bacterium]|nr:CDP-glycerol glycerophosphotransferase family protein [Clostridiales bacterium]